MNNWKWRSYQNDCFESIIENYQKGITQQLIVQATGLGKRSQAVFMAGKAKNCLFIAHTEELIQQAYDDFAKLYGFMNVGMIRGKQMDLDKRFVVSSPQTLINRLDKIPSNHFEMVQIDECHTYMAKTWYRVATYFEAKMRLGWTATPRRLDGLSLLDLFQQKTYEYGILKGIEEGYLCTLKGIRIKTNINITGAKKSMGDFSSHDLEALVDIPERNKLIVDSYEKYALERQFICFAVDTNHSVNIAKAFTERDYNVTVISSDVTICPDREGTISAFKRGEIQGLVNCQILTMGFDYSEVGAILDASPTMSESRYLQRVGRATRLKSQTYVDKFGQCALIIDFVDLSSRHQLVNSFELDKQLPALEKIFVDKEDRDKLVEKERQRREIKVVTITENDEYFDFIKPPKVKIAQSAKMMEEATPAQIKLLTWLDLYTEFDQDGNEIEYTKTTVAELLQSPILPWMKRKMIEWKYNPESATMAQYLAISKLVRDNQQKEEIEIQRQNNTAKMLEEVRKDAYNSMMDNLKHSRGALIHAMPTHNPDDYTNIENLTGYEIDKLPF